MSAAEIHGVDRVLDENHREETCKLKVFEYLIIERFVAMMQKNNAFIVKNTALYLHESFGFGSFSPVTQDPVSLFSLKRGK